METKTEPKITWHRDKEQHGAYVDNGKRIQIYKHDREWWIRRLNADGTTGRHIGNATRLGAAKLLAKIRILAETS